MMKTLKFLALLACVLVATGAQAAAGKPPQGAASAKVNAAPAGHLPDSQAGPYSFRCGAGFCDTRTSYCETIKTDVPELPSDYLCKPLPKSCKQVAGEKKDCSCFPEGTRCDYCGVIPGKTDGFYRTCVGGH